MCVVETIAVLICISLMISDVERPLTNLFLSYLTKGLFKSLQKWILHSDFVSCDWSVEHHSAVT